MKRLCLLAALLCGLVGAGFAQIAYDTQSNSADPGTAATYSWSHTVTGSNPLLLVCLAIVDTNGTPAVVSGITYNSVPLTQVQRKAGANSNATECWRLYGPAAGANTIAVTLSASPSICSIGGAVSLTGVDQANGVETSATGAGASGTNPSTAVTTVTDNDWVVDGAEDNHVGATPHSATAPATKRVDTSCGGVQRGISMSTQGPVHPAASTTAAWTNWGDAWTQVTMAIKPAGVGGAAAAGFDKRRKLETVDPN